MPALLLPVSMYAVFLGTNDNRGDSASALYLLAHYVSFAAFVPALYVFYVTAASERRSGFTQLRAVLQAPPPSGFLTRALLAALCAAVNAALLLLTHWLIGRVCPSPAQACDMIAVAMLGTLPPSALGLVIGSHCNGKPAIAAVNVLSIPIAISSGMLLPRRSPPAGLQALAVFSPGHDTLVLAVAAVRPDMPASVWQIIYLIAAALVLGALAAWTARRRR